MRFSCAGKHGLTHPLIQASSCFLLMQIASSRALLQKEVPKSLASILRGGYPAAEPGSGPGATASGQRCAWFNPANVCIMTRNRLAPATQCTLDLPQRLHTPLLSRGHGGAQCGDADRGPVHPDLIPIPPGFTRQSRRQISVRRQTRKNLPPRKENLPSTSNKINLTINEPWAPLGPWLRFWRGARDTSTTRLR